MESLGIRTETATEAPRDGASRSWHMADMPEWGTARTGWGTYQDRFADVSWFLWAEEDAEQVLEAATELADHLTGELRPPTEVTDRTSPGATWWWQLESHSIEMYAHGPHRYPPAQPCVKLSVALREVSDPREAEARRLAEATESP